ncbi:hypothetical protein SDC9_165883 [bioreactor metagenome]|uniref:Uncharacterized protein n=1 Tax=bioreactor metagenome TaxID=1076179 RepID=A0A645G3A9_9ZZZZ
MTSQLPISTASAVTASTVRFPSRLPRIRARQSGSAMATGSGMGVPASEESPMWIPDDAAVATGSGIGVHASEEEIAEISEDDGGEPEYQQPGGAPAPPAADDPGVQIGAIDQPGHQRRGLLRVPRPIASPGDVRPDRSEDDHDRQHRKGDDHRLVAEFVQHIGLGPAAPPDMRRQ